MSASSIRSTEPVKAASAIVYGYARCSLSEDKGQDINRQVRELKAAGATQIITEREHGDAKVKQALDLLLETAEPGSTIICALRSSAR